MMKKIITASVISLSIMSSAWAVQSPVSDHEMSSHQQAIIAHESMNNGSAEAHQKTIEMHKKMMGANKSAKQMTSC